MRQDNAAPWQTPPAQRTTDDDPADLRTDEERRDAADLRTDDEREAHDAADLRTDDERRDAADLRTDDEREAHDAADLRTDEEREARDEPILDTHDESAVHEERVDPDEPDRPDEPHAHDEPTHDDGVFAADARHETPAMADDPALTDERAHEHEPVPVSATYEDATAHDDATHDDATHDEAAYDDATHDEAPTDLKPGDVPVAPVAGLWTTDSAQGFRDRWREAQLRFIDDPRGVAEEMKGLVNEAVEALTSALSNQHSELDTWSTDGGDTEQYRVVVQRYRTFFERLLAL
jgi:hypothetical protein